MHSGNCCQPAGSHHGAAWLFMSLSRLCGLIFLSELVRLADKKKLPDQAGFCSERLFESYD